MGVPFCEITAGSKRTRINTHVRYTICSHFHHVHSTSRVDCMHGVYTTTQRMYTQCTFPTSIYWHMESLQQNKTIIKYLHSHVYRYVYIPYVGLVVV